MKLTIDNLDGLGVLDYTGAIWNGGSIEIERVLNASSRCSWQLVLSGTGLAVPQRRGRVTVVSESGSLLFTGYIATAPEQVAAGESMGSILYRIAVTAFSDEWLLDRQKLAVAGAGLSQTASSVLQRLTSRTGAGVVAANDSSDSRQVGVFIPDATENWSKNAASVAAAAYSGYRVISGALSLLSAGAVVHRFSDQDGTLSPGLLQASRTKELANDVTLTGEIEPTTYVTELFVGDGSTNVFKLSTTPFYPSRRSGGGTLLNDTFADESFDANTWSVSDPGGAMSLEGLGLALHGGNGQDGGTTLTSVAPVEMAGTVVLEVGGVELSTASNGMLGGLYSGLIMRQNCIAGFGVTQGNGTTIVTPIVNGAQVGTGFVLLNGHTYTLRLRVHCREAQRVNQIYYTMTEGTVQSFGGGFVAAPVDVVFECQDLGAASSSPATVLYDGTIAGAPAVCQFTLINAEQMFGSVNFCRVTRTGPTWIASTPPSAPKRTRLIGIAGEGADCSVSSSGTVTFFAGRVPLAGEMIAVTYRISDRSVARRNDPSSVAQETAAGIPGTAQWQGKVTSPPARSSIDCASAAMALLSLSTSPDAALTGRYVAVNPSTDIWPGDVLSLEQSVATTKVLARRVSVKQSGGWPEALTYSIDFANDWAETLGVGVVTGVAADTVLPKLPVPVTGVATVAALSQLQVLTMTGSALQIDAGIDALNGGGFEVRRRDGGFAEGSDQDLVLRSPVRVFTIPRIAQVEHFYIRAYSGAVPQVYSPVSSAVFTDAPVA